MAKELLTLSNICEGKLESEFQEAYTAIMSRLYPGKKGSITITINLKRVENTTTMAEVGYAMNAKLPPQKRAALERLPTAVC